MGLKSATFWLLVFGLCLVTANYSDENWDSDSDEDWESLPVRKPNTPTTTTERPLPPQVPTTTTTPTTTTERAPATTNSVPQTTTTERAPRPGRQNGYLYYEEAEGALKLHPAAAWRAARLTCFQEGAELASPETAGLLAALSSALLSSAPPPEQVFTGISDLYSKGLFTSLRGSPLAELPLRWAAGAPSGFSPRDTCLALGRDALLRDTPCDATLPYFCFKKKAPGPETECGTNPEYWYSRETSSCYKVHGSSAAWSEAYASCRREGALLLVLSSTQEALLMREQARKAKLDKIHVGATRWKDDVWMTIHGQTLWQAGFDKWKKEAWQPSAAASCAVLLFPEARFSNHICSEELAFICEKKAYL